MRISDWSSDVCSSDLENLPRSRQDCLRDRSERQRRPTTALEEIGAVEVLEPGDRLAYRGLGAAEEISCGREAFGLHDFQKHLELVEFGTSGTRRARSESVARHPSQLRRIQSFSHPDRKRGV